MLYIKVINGQEKILSCTTIQMPDGRWCSNPYHALIIESEEWEELP